MLTGICFVCLNALVNKPAMSSANIDLVQHVQLALALISPYLSI